MADTKQNFTLFVLVGLCFLFIHSIAEGAEWKYYGSDISGISFYYDYDKEKTTNSKGIIRIWQKIVYTPEIVRRTYEALGVKYGDLRECVNLLEIDCSNKKSQIKSTIYFNRNGTVIESIDYKDWQDWRPIPPDTALEKLCKEVCPKKREASDPQLAQ